MNCTKSHQTSALGGCLPLMCLVVTLSSSGLIFSFAAVRISFLSFATLHPLLPAVLVQPDTWGTHLIWVTHLEYMRKGESKNGIMYSPIMFINNCRVLYSGPPMQHDKLVCFYRLLPHYRVVGTLCVCRLLAWIIVKRNDYAIDVVSQVHLKLLIKGLLWRSQLYCYNNMF